MSITDVEQLFPPRPGGMVDTARKQQAAEQAQLDQLAQAPGAEDPAERMAIRVRPVEADLAVARTLTLSSGNPVAQLLPRDDARRSAIVLAVDNDVWISPNEGTAGDLAGTSAAGSAFYLPKGIAVPIVNRAQHWVACTTTATTSRVSILVNKDRAL